MTKTLIILSLLLCCRIAWADITPYTYTPEQICDAVWHAEGGGDAAYKYGIRSVEYRDTEDAREICLRSARNNIKRYTRYGHKNFDDYLRFFANRWAPVGAKNDPKGLNKYFYKNLIWFLNNPRRIDH